MKTGTLMAIIGILFIVGIGGGYWYLNNSGSAVSGGSSTGAVSSDQAGTASPEEVGEPVGGGEHGSMPDIPSGAAICETHHVPELICSFCNPSFIEEYGYCSGHEVAEVLCTRCHPELIVAFKAENDWCAEHGLPESQCTMCNHDPGDGG